MKEYLHAPFILFDNYYDILFNPYSPIKQGLTSAIRNTVYYAFFVTIGQLSMGMIVALLLNRPFRGRSLMRTLFLFPWIVPTFVTGLLWGFMWQKDIGIINYLIYDVAIIKFFFFKFFICI
ncbi:MAG: sugar ABC transporter, permease protein [Candidatus Magnetoglobus multicellularis str. Araruama]|uniref:Sugar ABC transporter, permease protein n=1 Tax=Candidatus Magnetoglobus multicellularis str. Araruama TaxID=890399 RepID=A0A1V1NVW8_9BACT|nr:MAG: sugar ABC transporter, permease protein [Candidatus Magnetoglobus multicellularis str. Araruama]